MEVKIGIQHAPRELAVDVDQDADAIEQQLREALNEGEGLLTLTDQRGRRVVVPASRIAYVEINAGTAGQVGFRS